MFLLLIKHGHPLTALFPPWKILILLLCPKPPCTTWDLMSCWYKTMSAWDLMRLRQDWWPHNVYLRKYVKVITFPSQFLYLLSDLCQGISPFTASTSTSAKINGKETYGMWMLSVTGSLSMKALTVLISKWRLGNKLPLLKNCCILQRYFSPKYLFLAGKFAAPPHFWERSFTSLLTTQSWNTQDTHISLCV